MSHAQEARHPFLDDLTADAGLVSSVPRVSVRMSPIGSVLALATHLREAL
jgi:hypothetical protein